MLSKTLLFSLISSTLGTSEVKSFTRALQFFFNTITRYLKQIYKNKSLVKFDLRRRMELKIFCIISGTLRRWGEKEEELFLLFCSAARAPSYINKDYQQEINTKFGFLTLIVTLLNACNSIFYSPAADNLRCT